MALEQNRTLGLGSIILGCFIAALLLSILLCFSDYSAKYQLHDFRDTEVIRAYNNNCPKIVSCYYNFPNNLDNSSQLMPENIKPYFCTHINVAFGIIRNKSIVLEESQKSAIKRILQLKKVNPNLKILLSIGGSGNDHGFSDMVVDHASRKTFIKSIKSVLRNLTLDGIDLDWEFPVVHLTQAKLRKNRERQHFSQLLREIRAEYIREKRPYILSVAVAAPDYIVKDAYDVDQINDYVDYVNLMTYDYHFYSKYTPFTGLNSPVYARKEETFYMSTLNINYTVHMYIEKGLDRNKIVVGIPTYGHSYKLINPSNSKIGSPASGFGTIGGHGFVDYSDVCQFINGTKPTANIVYDSDAKVPYAYKDQNWISYDTSESVFEKARFAIDNQLGGVMIYSLNADDYKGLCSNGIVKFPLTRSVRRAMINATCT